MADGRDDNFNFPAKRGAKLRNQGSNPTGDQTMSFTPEYSEGMDYSEQVALNKRTRMDSTNYSENTAGTETSRKDGLNLKQPLS